MSEDLGSEIPQQAQVQELSTASAADVKTQVNQFLNGLGTEGSYDWTDKKFDFMLKQNPTYKVAYMEKDGQIIAAKDYQFGNDTINLLRVRTSPEQSKAHAAQNGLTLGDEIFDSVIQENPSAKRIYSEVNPSGMRYLKRQAQRRNLTVTRELTPDKTGFGAIEINLDKEQQAKEARMQKLQQLHSTIKKAA